MCMCLFVCVCVCVAVIANHGVVLSSFSDDIVTFSLSHSLVVCVLADLLSWC